MTTTAQDAVRPHVPDEPAQRDRWRAEVVRGTELVTVLGAPDGLIQWLWARWHALQGAGWTRDGFAGVALGYRRELWLWMAGERTWAHCCSGLLGRLGRRPPV